MPTYTVKSRKTGPIEFTTVDAATREQAIAQTVAAAAEGESVEVMDAKEGAVEDEEVSPSKK
jgi:hypothetical protein